MYSSCSGFGHATGSGHRSTVVVLEIDSSDRFSGLIWIQRFRELRNLVEVALSCEMRALGADISQVQECVVPDFPLDIQMPLLHVRPNRLSGNRWNTYREEKRRIASIGRFTNVFV